MWHIYNRGVDKRLIFLDERDYTVFLSYIKCALSPEIDSELKNEALDSMTLNRIRRLRLYDELKLVSYCLMPNHFHLQLYQISADGISKFMRSVMTGYVTYFNHRYDRSGRLFQGVYKGSLITTDSYFQHLSRYIHLNAVDVVSNYKVYDFSSFKYFTDKVSVPSWLAPDLALCDMTAPKYEAYCDDYLTTRNALKETEAHFADH